MDLTAARKSAKAGVAAGKKVQALRDKARMADDLARGLTLFREGQAKPIVSSITKLSEKLSAIDMAQNERIQKIEKGLATTIPTEFHFPTVPRFEPFTPPLKTLTPEEAEMKKNREAFTEREIKKKITESDIMVPETEAEKISRRPRRRALRRTPKPSATGSGFGQQKRHAFKVDKENNSFGNFNVDLPKLRGSSRLVVTNKGGQVVKDQMSDKSFVDLLTKRFNPKTNYSPKSLELFSDLVNMSGMSSHKRSGKNNLVKRGGGLIIDLSNPRKVLEDLALRVANRRSGNNSVDLRNEIVTLLSYMEKEGLLDRETVQKISQKAFLGFR